MSYQTHFVVKEGPEPHRSRTAEIIKSHPEIRNLIEKNPMTAVITVACVAAQILIAYLLRDQSWWLIFGLAWVVGAFPTHTLFVCIHEAAHNLVFKSPRNNTLIAIVGNFPSIVPTAITFKNFHIKHHAFQGVHDLDADIPSVWEARLINNYSVGKMIWLLFYPLFQMFRTFRCPEARVIDRWVILNIVVQFAFDAAIIYFFGWKAIAYMFISFFFSVGLHPLGARWIQEHFLVLDKDQETYSYYGRLNTLNLNVGFHNEHHDMPSIPWNNLPKLKKVAPEFYDDLLSHQSYTKLFFTFLFSQEVGIFSRIIRKDRAGVKLEDDSTPDLQLLKQRG